MTVRSLLCRVASSRLLLLVSLTLLCACDQSRSSTDTEVAPVNVTLTASKLLLPEDGSESAEITATLATPVDRRVGIELQLRGNAELGVDYEISSRSIAIEPGNVTNTVILTPSRDWDADPGESVIVSLGTISGNGIAATPSTAQIFFQDDGVPDDYKQNISADLRVFSDLHVSKFHAFTDARVYNLGAAESSATDLLFLVRTDLRDSSTTVYRRDERIPVLGASAIYTTSFALLLSRLQSNQTYYAILAVRRTPEETSARSAFGSDYFGFSLDDSGEIISQCVTEGENPVSGLADPLTQQQWHLENTGQTAFAMQGGVANADANARNTLQSGPYGEDIVVAVVDTGLEICHADLIDNIEPNLSYNFAASPLADLPWYGAVETDPFNPTSLGDHGTAVAGIIASVRNNGIGGQGIAPHAKLRGFNYLTYQSSGQATSLGSSRVSPSSADVDIFNLSYGVFGYQGRPPSSTTRVLRLGTTSLRGGLGSIYVKAAGNGFGSCSGIEHEIHSEIGCRASVSDPTNNLPYVIVVGGFNANDQKSSYAGAGSNLWVTAPSGEFGDEQPAIITTDQQGSDRGYNILSPRGLAVDRSANPSGNYISTFNGTSASAPMVSGAVALLLDANPDLTWRDVKHILASTARKLDPDIKPVRISFGGTPYTLQHEWTQNDAGYWFHNYYGFGAVDIDAAVEMAKNYDADSRGTFAESDWITSNVDLTVPEFDGDGIESTINVADLPPDAIIEAVSIQLDGRHERLSDIGISLTSPAGTTSVLNPIFNDTLATSTTLRWELLSNAFYGESPTGDWTLKVVDAAEGDTGNVSSWKIKIYYGHD